MMISQYLRYFKIILLLGAFMAGWYSGYSYYNVKQLKIDLKVSHETIKSKDMVISKMETSEKITNDILTKSAFQRQQEKINYENVYTKLEATKKHLDASNHINADLVRFIQDGVNGKVSNATTASRINEKAPIYRASSLSRGVINWGERCNENTNQLNLLIEWYLKQYGVYNK